MRSGIPYNQKLWKLDKESWMSVDNNIVSVMLVPTYYVPVQIHFILKCKQILLARIDILILWCLLQWQLLINLQQAYYVVLSGLRKLVVEMAGRDPTLEFPVHSESRLSKYLLPIILFNVSLVFCVSKINMFPLIGHAFAYWPDWRNS